jgi:hypothetical protein
MIAKLIHQMLTCHISLPALLEIGCAGFPLAAWMDKPGATVTSRNQDNASDRPGIQQLTGN